MEKPVVIVTGAGQGIGRAIARDLAGHGWRVAVIDADAEAGEEALAELQKIGEVRFIASDVARESDVTAMTANVLESYGRVDALVNNAAIACNKPLMELSLEEWNHVLGVNLTGAFLCSKYAAPHLRATNGSIVNMASTRAQMSEPDTEAYSTSKGGVVALTHALALSLGPQIRVNCISPGWIETGEWKKSSARYVPQLTGLDHAQHPAGRVGRPEDVAALVRYLLSDEAGFITAANLVIDGGMTRKMIYAEP
ncbi:MAG: SDR family oxidoreductase [Gammaproteobacteria bacterium]